LLLAVVVVEVWLQQAQPRVAVVVPEDYYKAQQASRLRLTP
jgi:hypothetical protein